MLYTMNKWSDIRRKPHNIYIEDQLWEAASERARAENTSTAQIINISLSTYLGTQASTSTGTEVQMEHEATGPSHRKVARPAEVANSGAVDPDDEPF